MGKFVTVYPKTPTDAVSIARKLHSVTHDLPGPAVPYDRLFRRGSRVHYRFGSFGTLETGSQDGTQLPGVHDSEGNVVPDLREPGAAVPNWVTDPFVAGRPDNDNTPAADSPLKTKFLAYEALSQRGKGGVYRALDLSVSPPRLCILKEGRRHGETDWDGRDGYWRVRHEGQVLSSLSSSSVAIPEVHAEFRVGTHHYYLATELIEGQNFQAFLLDNEAKIPVARGLEYGAQLAKLLSNIHSAGWVWMDCKPLNLILSQEGVLRPIDFEGACPVGSPDMMPWGTAGYVPPEWLERPAAGSRVFEDLYALGATLNQILCGQVPAAMDHTSTVETLSRRVPPSVAEIILALLDPDPRSRPDAHATLRALMSAC